MVLKQVTRRLSSEIPGKKMLPDRLPELNAIFLELFYEKVDNAVLQFDAVFFHGIFKLTNGNLLLCRSVISRNKCNEFLDEKSNFCPKIQF